MASNKRPNYLGPKALPFGGQFYPLNYGPHCPPNWWPISSPQEMSYPQMWSQNGQYFRPHFNYSPTEHSIDCCLSPNNRNGCQQTTSLCTNCQQTDDVSNDMIVIDEIRDHSILLESTLEDKTRKLRDTKLKALETNEKQSINAIEVRQKLLRQMLDQIQYYCQRFEDNNSIVKECLQLSDQLYVDLVKTNEIKQRFITQISDQRLKINENADEEYHLLVVDDQMSPELPDLGPFYRLLIDKINPPLVDVSVPSVEVSVPSVEENGIDGAVDQEEVLNLGLVEDNISVPNDDIIDDLFLKESKVGQTFGNDLHPIIELSFTMTSDTKQQIEDLIGFKEDFKVVTEANLMLNISTSNESMVSNSVMESSSNSNRTLNESKLTANPMQQKILDKLKTNYPNITEDSLFDSMVKTKDLFIRFGQNKGFTGMKVCDIVTAVSQFIESESNNVSKTDDIPTNPETENRGINGFGGDSEICGICSKPIANKSDNQTLSCEHGFHFRCLEVWAQTNNRCPNCRQLI